MVKHCAQCQPPASGATHEPKAAAPGREGGALEATPLGFVSTQNHVLGRDVTVLCSVCSPRKMVTVQFPVKADVGGTGKIRETALSML